MNRIARVARLQLARPQDFLQIVGLILGISVAVCVIVALAIQRGGADPQSADYVDGFRSNQAVAWSVAGYLVTVGAQSVATRFPLGMALGATRRHFTLGTLVYHVLVAAAFTLLAGLGLALERATRHWFVGAYLFDSHVLGGGDLRALAVRAFLGCLVALSLGAGFGGIWIRFRNKGVTVSIAGLVLVLALALLWAVPRFERIAAAYEPWWLAAGAGAGIALAAATEFATLARATVR